MSFEVGDIREARLAYQRDDVGGAYQFLTGIGAAMGGTLLRFYRVVEAEAVARELGQIAEIGPGLNVEPDIEDETIAIIVDGFQMVEARLGRSERDALITFLPEEMDAPWLEPRFGYYVAKIPYDKICLPSSLLQHPHELAGALRHEIAHRVIRDISQDRAPLWLHEGLACLLEGRHESPWRRDWTPQALNAAFELDRRAEGGVSRAGEAYHAAHTLVAHLHRLGGDDALRTLLPAFTDNSLWDNAKQLVGLESPADEALKQTFGISETELFASLKPT